MTGHKIIRNVPGFNFDTAISIGASIYGSRKTIIKDITSKTIGIEVKINGKAYVEHLIMKNKLLPVYIEEKFKAEHNAVLKVYEGESHRPEECILRGRLELGNPEGSVKVTMNVNVDGLLTSGVEFEPNVKRNVTIKTDDGEFNKHDMKSKILTIDLRV